MKLFLNIKNKLKERNMKKKILALIEELNKQLQESRNIKNIHSEYTAGYISGSEKILEQTIKQLQDLLPKEK